MKDDLEAAFGCSVHDDDVDVLLALAQTLARGGTSATRIRDVSAASVVGPNNQGLAFQPQLGQIVVCNFNLGFQPPEIRKVRPVMVVSPPPRFRSGLATVIAISSQPPQNPQPYHVQLPKGLVPGANYSDAWAKCDVIHQVGLNRLDRIKAGHRNFVAPIAPAAVVKAVRIGMLHALGLDSLTGNL